MQPLAGPLLDAALAYLGATPATPDLALLNRLLMGYGQAAPWESASRIVKRARVDDYISAPRWSEEFWGDALARGTGGTCFESNAAFLALLHALGYEGYLTINDMGDTVGCHTALVVQLEVRPWLVEFFYDIFASPLLAAVVTPFLDAPVQPAASAEVPG